MKKKNSNKFFWYYLVLFILVVLLLLPIGLRLFGKNLYEKKENSDKDIIEVLNCNKDNATINSTFLNSVPQNLLLEIKGDYSINRENNNSTSLNISNETNNVTSSEEDLIKYIRNYSEINYSNQNDVTSFKVDMANLKQIDEYIVLFNNIENQQKYFVSQAFSCNIVKY